MTVNLLSFCIQPNSVIRKGFCFNKIRIPTHELFLFARTFQTFKTDEQMPWNSCSFFFWPWTKNKLKQHSCLAIGWIKEIWLFLTRHLRFGISLQLSDNHHIEHHNSLGRAAWTNENCDRGAISVNYFKQNDPLFH